MDSFFSIITAATVALVGTGALLIIGRYMRRKLIPGAWRRWYALRRRMCAWQLSRSFNEREEEIFALFDGHQWSSERSDILLFFQKLRSHAERLLDYRVELLNMRLAVTKVTHGEASAKRNKPEWETLSRLGDQHLEDLSPLDIVDIELGCIKADLFAIDYRILNVLKGQANRAAVLTHMGTARQDLDRSAARLEKSAERLVDALDSGMQRIITSHREARPQSLGQRITAAARPQLHAVTEDPENHDAPADEKNPPKEGLG